VFRVNFLGIEIAQRASYIKFGIEAFRFFAIRFLIVLLIFSYFASVRFEGEMELECYFGKTSGVEINHSKLISQT